MARDEEGEARSGLRAALVRRLPLLGWLRNYSREDAVSDCIAGVTLGLTMIPQSIAYAALAGLTPQDGLNSSFVGCILYAFFGTIKEVVIGPTSLMALLTYEYTSELTTDFVVLLGFLCGVVEFLMGVLHLGFLVELISAPVVSGFTTATSLIIVVSQMKGLIGLKFKSDGIVDNMVKLYENIHSIRPGDTLLGVVCIIFLLCFRKLKEVKVSERVPCRSAVQKLLWFLSTGRNALAVLLSALVALHFKSSGSPVPFITTKSGDTSLPVVRLPPFSTTVGNRTYGFGEMVGELGSGFLVIPVISVLANVAIAKAFVNGAVDATQEMLTLSLCNMAGSLVQSMPTTGAFTRSAVASASGIRTPIAGLYAAGLTLMALGFLGPYFHYIPRATLAAILIAAVIFLVDWEIVPYLWNNSWLDLFTVAVTLVSCMSFGVEVGLLVGVVTGLIYMIYKWARPGVTVKTVKREEGRVVRVTPRAGLYFPAVDHVAEVVTKAALREGSGRDPVLVDCGAFIGTDFTVAKGIKSLKTAFDKRGQPIKFINVPSNCYKLWVGSGCTEDCFSAISNGHTTFGDNSHPMKVLGEADTKEQEGEELLKHPANDNIA